MSRRIALLVTMSVFACSQAQAVLITDTIDLQGSSGSFTGSSPVFTLAGNSVTSGGLTINYDLVLNVDWLDGATSVGGFEGALHGAVNLGVTTTLMAGTPGSIDEEHNDVDAFIYENPAATFADIREELNFTAVVTSVTGGTISSQAFTAYQTGNVANAGITATGLNTPSLALVVDLGMDPMGNTDNSDFRMEGITIEFDATAVPEPSQWSMFGLIGILFAGRRWKRQISG